MKSMRLYLLAALILFITCIGACDTKTKARPLTSHNTDLILKKRSSSNSQERSSRERGNDARSYRDFPNESDTPERPNISSENYLGLIEKAIEKAGGSSLREGIDYLQEGSFKWLTRAEASMMRDPTLIAQIQRDYAIKASHPHLAPRQAERAREKLAQWTRLARVPISAELRELLSNIARSYQEDIDLMMDVWNQWRENEGSEMDMADASRKLAHAQSALRMWNCNTTDSRSAFEMVNKELHAYVEMSEHLGEGRDAGVRLQMLDHVIKAIVWLNRARQLQSQD